MTSFSMANIAGIKKMISIKTQTKTFKSHLSLDKGVLNELIYNFVRPDLSKMARRNGINTMLSNNISLMKTRSLFRDN